MTLPARDADQDVLGELLLLALERVVGTFERAQVPLPDRQYISYGSVVADCAQLTVELGQLYPGSPGSDPSQTQRCDGPRTAVLLIQLFREAPTVVGGRGPTAPTVAALNAIAVEMSRDAWLLLDAAQAIDAAGWNTGVIAEVSPVATSGGYIGSSMTLTLQVP